MTQSNTIFSLKADKQTIFRVIQIACLCLFAGRAFQHIVWDAPYRAIFWDEDFMEPIINWLGMSWNDYVTDVSMDRKIQNLILGTGIFYLICVFISLFIKKVHRHISKLLLLAAASLIFLAYLYYKEKFYDLGQFYEYTIQWSVPLFLYAYVFKPQWHKRLILPLKLAVAITFGCHGLYAIGYYPVPAHFIDMTIEILGFSESGAKWFLIVFGVLDFVMALALFNKRTIKVALFYAIFWGFVTALARIVANFNIDFIWPSLSQWLPETIYRLPHSLMPLALLLMITQKQNASFTEE